MEDKILVGNTYPVGLIRRQVITRPVPLTLAKVRLQRGFCSFWGHNDTLKTASEALGVDVTPSVERPALSLSANNLPELFGEEFTQVLIFSPSYKKGFRPTYGVEVTTDQITEWVPLIMTFGKET